MTRLGKHLRALWVVFAIWSAAWLWPRWVVEMPLRYGAAPLPLARSGFLPGGSEPDPDIYFHQVYHYLCNTDHVDELERVDGVESVVLDEPEPVPLPATRMVNRLVVDGVEIVCTNDNKPMERAVLTRVLRDAARIEWRMLWDRALAGTAAWLPGLAAMIGLTWLLRRKGARSKRVTERE